MPKPVRKGKCMHLKVVRPFTVHALPGKAIGSTGDSCGNELAYNNGGRLGVVMFNCVVDGVHDSQSHKMIGHGFGIKVSISECKKSMHIYNCDAHFGEYFFGASAASNMLQ